MIPTSAILSQNTRVTDSQANDRLYIRRIMKRFELCNVIQLKILDRHLHVSDKLSIDFYTALFPISLDFDIAAHNSRVSLRPPNNL